MNRQMGGMPDNLKQEEASPKAPRPVDTGAPQQGGGYSDNKPDAPPSAPQ